MCEFVQNLPIHAVASALCTANTSYTSCFAVLSSLSNLQDAWSFESFLQARPGKIS